MNSMYGKCMFKLIEFDANIRNNISYVEEYVAINDNCTDNVLEIVRRSSSKGYDHHLASSGIQYPGQ